MQQFRTTWGLVGEHLPWPDLTSFIIDAAPKFDGVEFPLAHLAFESDVTDTAVSKVKDTLAATQLDVIALIATRPDAWSDPAEHFQDFLRQAKIASALGATKAAVHCGADAFDTQVSIEFLNDVLAASADLNLLPCIETHRGRPMYNPWSTATLLDALPDMRLTSDLSHWHVVVDRVPNDIMDIFDEASRRSSHVHARIGHEKGAQVPHPADPIWAEHVAMYRRWWGLSKESMERRGEVFTVSSEFGPPPYMNTRPFTHEPDCDLVELNAWMQERLQEWYG